MTTAFARLSATPLTLDVAGTGYRGATLGELQAAPWSLPEADLLPAVKGVLKGWIDDHAETLRLSLITPGSGQAMEYQEAQRESAAILALADTTKADAADYPMLAASVGTSVDPTTGKPTVDIPGEARAVDAARKGWVAAGAAIRDTRLKGKAAIEKAGTIEDACAAVDAVAWPSLN
ncbi:hypothetical protein [Methylobacterium sp. SI9]|uniref:hypothetical protein n=1 Tax=Methylobacterium guangdongense TaxID=3138811 RepID=UPI00313D4FE8